MEAIGVCVMASLRLEAALQGVLDRLQTLVHQAEGKNPLFVRWSKVLRQDAKERIARGGEGWAPLAESTKKRMAQTRTSPITVRGQVRKGHAKQLRIQLRKQVKSGRVEGDAPRLLKKLVQGGKAALSMDVAQTRSSALLRLQKQLRKASAGKRVGGDQRQLQKHKPLGKLASSLMAKPTAMQAVCESRAPWSGVHQHGGRAGQGAQIPARPFFVVSDALRERLSHEVLAHLLPPQEGE